MADIKTFIKEARDKNLTDTQIREALASQGWEAGTIDLAISGLEVPTPPASLPQQTTATTSSHRPTLGPLMAALHHVLLWFFTGSSSVTIMGVVASLSGYEVSATALASMIAVTVVTFIPYAALFITYLAKNRRQPGLIPGKVWSIITICLHSVGAMIAAITLVVSLINEGDSAVITGAALILTLNVIVLGTYCFAAFAGVGLFRKLVILLYIPALVILFGILSVMSLLQLGPARHDEQLRKDLAKTVVNVRNKTNDTKSLPESGAGLTVNGTEYKRTSADTYEVCGTFQTKKQSQYRDYDYSSPRYDMSDEYVSESIFVNTDAGNKCFTFTSSVLKSTSSILQPDQNEFMQQ